MKGKFTPLNKGFAIELAKKYNLVEGCFGAECGNFDMVDLPNETFSSVKSFGIDLNSANNHPLIDIMENKLGQCVVCLYESPYLAENYNRDGTIDCYYIEPCSDHIVSSVERFEKYLKEGIENYKKIYVECKERNEKANCRNPYDQR